MGGEAKFEDTSVEEELRWIRAKIKKRRFAMNRFINLLHAVVECGENVEASILKDLYKVIVTCKNTSCLAEKIAEFLANHQEEYHNIKDAISVLIELSLVEASTTWQEFRLRRKLSNINELQERIKDFVDEWNEEVQNQKVIVKMYRYREGHKYLLTVVFFIKTGESPRPKIIDNSIKYISTDNISILVLKFKPDTVISNKNLAPSPRNKIYTFLKKLVDEVLSNYDVDIEGSEELFRSIGTNFINSIVLIQNSNIEEFIQCNNVKQKLRKYLNKTKKEYRKILRKIIEDLAVIGIKIEIETPDSKEPIKLGVHVGKNLSSLSGILHMPSLLENIISIVRALSEKEYRSGEVTLTIGFRRSIIQPEESGYAKIIISSQGFLKFDEWLRKNHEEIIEELSKLFRIALAKEDEQ